MWAEVTVECLKSVVAVSCVEDSWCSQLWLLQHKDIVTDWKMHALNSQDSYCSPLSITVWWFDKSMADTRRELTSAPGPNRLLGWQSLSRLFSLSSEFVWRSQVRNVWPWRSSSIDLKPEMRSAGTLSRRWVISVAWSCISSPSGTSSFFLRHLGVSWFYEIRCVHSDFPPLRPTASVISSLLLWSSSSHNSETQSENGRQTLRTPKAVTDEQAFGTFSRMCYGCMQHFLLVSR